MPKLFLLFFCSFFSLLSFAQEFKIIGKITNTKLEALAFVTIQVKESPINTLSKENGSFELTLEKGKYDLVVSLVGYKAQTIAVVVNNSNEVVNVILEENIKSDVSATVIGQKKDRAEELIRNVIRNKEKNTKSVNSYAANIYIRATEETTSPKKVNPKVKKVDSANIDLLQMSMAEIQMQLDFMQTNRTKETRNGVKKRGNPEGLFYLSTTEGDFSLYNNLIKVKALGETPFLSPISYSGLVAYRYKTIRTRKVDGRSIYTISYRPTKMGNALLNGEVEIIDSTWVILSSKFSLPKFHLVEYDNFEVEQEYQQLEDSIWLFKKQKFIYNAKVGKSSKNGVTTLFYNDYDLHKVFPKKHFGVELSTTSKEAYERDSMYWQTVRTEPLTEKEIRFIRYKDSVYRATNTQQYYDSIDAVTNKITVKKILLDGLTFYNRKKERTITAGALTNLYEPLSPGGARLGYNGSYKKTFKTKKDIYMNTDISYGIRNQDINGSFSFSRLYNPFNRGYYYGNIGRDFDQLFQGDVLINSFQKRNIFRKSGLVLGHGVELLNGLFLANELELVNRKSLVGFKFFDWASIVKDTSGFDSTLRNNTPRNFEQHNAFYNKITLRYTPFQQYMREPLQKVILGSKWPSFTLMWKKGIPNVFGSAINYDYVEFMVDQTIQLGTVGVSKYEIKMGTFPNRDSIQLADKKFMRGRDPYLFFSPQTNFQHLDTTFELTKFFIEGHYLHEFNGAILNKIPILKKLQLRESAGAGFLIAPERNLRYFEAFVGIELKPFNIFKEKFKLGVFVVGSVSNQPTQVPIQLKFSIRQWDRRGNRWL